MKSKSLPGSRLKALFAVLTGSILLASCMASGPAYAVPSEKHCNEIVQLGLETQKILLQDPDAIKIFEEKIQSNKSWSKADKKIILEEIYFIENRKNLPAETLKQLVFLRCISETI